MATATCVGWWSCGITGMKNQLYFSLVLMRRVFYGRYGGVGFLDAAALFGVGMEWVTNRRFNWVW